MHTHGRCCTISSSCSSICVACLDAPFLSLSSESLSLSESESLSLLELLPELLLLLESSSELLSSSVEVTSSSSSLSEPAPQKRDACI